MTTGRATLTVLTVLCLGITSWALASERNSVTTRVGNDLFLAGSDVRVTAGSPGDALLAGGWISTAGTVHGDEVATGGQLNLGADVDGGVYAAGGRVHLDGRVAHNARLAGGHVELGPQAEVQGGVSIGGGEVAVNGRVAKYLQIGAGRTRIDAPVGGDVEVASGQLTVGPHAVIDGALTYYGPQPADIDGGAQIRGGTHYIERKRWQRPGHHRAFGAASWVWLAGWVVAGGILSALWPQFIRQMSEVARGNSWVVLLLGFAVLVCVPVALLFLFVTIVGIPLALLLLLLYLLLLPLGYLAAAAVIGEWLLSRARGAAPRPTAERLLVLIGVLIVLFLLTRIPVLGGTLRFLLIVAGIGSLVMTGALRQRGETAMATPT